MDSINEIEFTATITNQKDLEKKVSSVIKNIENKYKIDLNFGEINNLNKAIKDITAIKNVIDKLDLNKTISINGLSNIKDQIDVLKKSLSNLGLQNQNIDSNSINQLSENVNNIGKEIKNVTNNLNSSVGTAKNNINDLKDSLDFNNNINDIRTSLDKVNLDTKTLNESIKNQINDVKQWNSELVKGLKEDDKAAENTKEEIKNMQLEIGKVDSNIKKNNDKMSFKELNDSIKEQIKYVKQWNSELSKGLKEDDKAAENTRKQIDTIGKSIVELENKMSSLKDKKGFISDSENLKKYENELNNLYQTLYKLSSNKYSPLSNADFDKAKDSIKNANAAIKEIDSNVTGSVQHFQTFGEKIQSALGNVGIYITLRDVTRKLFEEIKDGTKYVEYLDQSFTDMEKTMSISKTDFEQMSNTIDEEAKKLGILNEKYHDIARIYSNNKTNVQEVLAQSTPAAMLANVADMDAATTTKALQSIINQFDMLKNSEEDAGKVTEHIGDVLVSTSANMKMDFGEGIKELTDAVKTAGSVAEQGKVSFEKFSAIAGATMQQAGISGTQFANMYKMFQGMTLKQKSLTEDLGIDETKLANGAKALKLVNLELGNGTVGGLKATDQIMSAIADKWDGLTDAAKQYIAFNVAGTRQISAFEAMIKSAKNSQDLYNSALDSTGELQKANAKQAESIQGRMNTLSDTVKQGWANIINSDFIKFGITRLSELATAFSDLKVSIGLAVAALIAFKGASIASAISGFVTQLISAVHFSNLFKIALGEIDILMSTNPFGLLALAIGSVAAAFGAADIAAERDKQKIEELNKEIEEYKTNISSLQDTKRKYDELSSKTNKTVEEEKELASIQNSLVEKYPDLLQDIDAEGNCHIKNSQSIDEEIKKQKELQALKVQEQVETIDKSSQNIISQNKDKPIKTGTDAYTDLSLGSNKQQLESLQNALKAAKEGSSAYEHIKQKIAELTVKMRENDTELENNANILRQSSQSYATLNSAMQNLANGALEKVTKQWKNGSITTREYINQVDKLSFALSSTNVQQAYENYKNLNDEFKNGNASAEDAHKAYKDLVNELIKANVPSETIAKYMREIATESDKAGKAGENAFNKMGKSAKEAESSIKDFSNTYTEANNKVKAYNSILKELNETNELTADTKGEILSKYQELLPYIGSEDELRQKLIAAIKEETQAENDAMNQAYAASLADKSNTDAKINNEAIKRYAIEQTAEKEGTSSKNVTDTLSSNYKADIDNHASAQRIKVANADGTGFTFVNGMKNAKDGMQSAYQADVDNFIDACNIKIQKGNEAAQKIQSVWDSLKVAGDSGDIDKYNEDVVTMTKFGNKWYKQYQAYVTLAGQISHASIGNVGSSGYRSVGIPTMTGGSSGSKGGSGSRGKSGSGRSGSAGKSNSGNSAATKQKVEDIEAISLRYYEYDNAINLVTNSLQELETINKRNTGKEKIKNLYKEIDLYEKQRSAINNKIAAEKSEKEELKRYLLSMTNFKFDKDGNILDAQHQIDKLVNWANNKSDDVKKKFQENVKKCEDAVTRYAELNNEEIPKLTNQWKELNNTIQEQYENMYGIIVDQEEKIGNVIKYYAEKNTKEVTEEYDKMTESINKYYETQDKQTNINDQKQKLAEIKNKMDKYSNDLSKSGQMKLQELAKEYNEAQKALDKTIRDNQKEAELQAIQDMKDAKEKALSDFENPNNLNKIIEEGLKTGMINVMGEVYNLQEANTNMLKETEIGYANVNKQIKEMNDSLQQSTELYKNLGYIADRLNITIDKTPSEQYNNSTISNISNNFDIKSNVNVEASMTKEEVENIAERVAKEIAEELKEELNKKLNFKR